MFLDGGILRKPGKIQKSDRLQAGEYATNISNAGKLSIHVDTLHFFNTGYLNRTCSLFSF